MMGTQYVTHDDRGSGGSTGSIGDIAYAKTRARGWAIWREGVTVSCRWAGTRPPLLEEVPLAGRRALVGADVRRGSSRTHFTVPVVRAVGDRDALADEGGG